ncbi:MAG: isoprenyl transferase [Muribaculaceae bacterium]|nr:isoprenyl transferase [Muribaculaceae bacterium]
MQEADLSHIDLQRVPEHVAIIMDGNGRWAQARGLDRSAGHVEGVNTVRRITEIASAIGVRYLTLYTFSTENWNRPQQEVDILMHLIVTAIERETPDLIHNNVRLTMIGDMERLPRFAAERLQSCFADTAHCTGLNLILALSYSARWEITRAVKDIVREVESGELLADDITDDTVSAHLSTEGIPDPDLLIRTGGDFRISNFLLWQLSYAEIIITDNFWPDFTRQDFVDCIAAYQRRQRRFGLTAEQL